MGICGSSSRISPGTPRGSSSHKKGARDFKTDHPLHEELRKSQFAEETVTTNDNIRDKYDFKKVIGHGHFGIVRMATLTKDPNTLFAIKSLEKEKVKRDMHLLKRELAILKRLDHPNIIKFYDTYQDAKSFYFVMEFCPGGNLMEWIIKRGKPSEEEVSKIMEQALSAVKYLHEVGIAHRDLKPENFLFQSDKDDAELRLIDFGLSRYLGDNSDAKLTSMLGTPLYMAPEMIKGQYDERVDIWSLGVMMYVLLMGNAPFDGRTTNEIYTNITKGKYLTKGEDWDRISKRAKDLLAQLLITNPNDRIIASEALEHPWFRDMNVKSLKKMKTLAQEAQKQGRHDTNKAVVSNLKDGEMKDLLETFRKLDKGNRDTVSLAEFQSILSALGYQFTMPEFYEFMKRLKLDNQRINYYDFIAGVMDKKYFHSVAKVWEAFKHLDEDENEIKPALVKDVLNKSGKKASGDDLKALLSSNKNVTFEEIIHICKIDEKPGSLDEYMKKYKR